MEIIIRMSVSAIKKIDKNHFSPDINEFLDLLSKHKVQYLIIGGEAVIFYGHARLTGDIDIFFYQKPANVKKLFFALTEFWDNDIPGIKDYKELLEKNVILQFGVPPNRLDIISNIGVVTFKEAWEEKVSVKLETNKTFIDIYYISLNKLIENKSEIKRPKDVDDLQFLTKIKNKI